MKMERGKYKVYRARPSSLTELREDISDILKDYFYVEWLSLDMKDKDTLLNKMERVFRRNVIHKELMIALAKDIIKEGDITTIDMSSNVFKYLKRTIYRGDLRKMLVELKSVIEDV